MGINMQKRTAVITGAASGVGRETALAFAKKGIDVALIDVQEKKLKQLAEHMSKYKIRTKHYKLDISDRKKCKATIKRIKNDFKRIDFLFNNAGLGIYSPFENMKEEDLEKMLDVNFKGALWCTKAVYPIMKKQKFGHIINLASVAGKYGLPNEAAYNSSKFAMVGFGQSLKKEGVFHGVRVDNICPGGIDTPFWNTPKNKRKVKDFLKPHWVADLVLYIALSPEKMVFEDIVVHPHSEYKKRFA